jgi:hypothetical protein
MVEGSRMGFSGGLKLSCLQRVMMQSLSVAVTKSRDP